MTKILDRLEEIIISLLIASATVVIFIAVLHRYGFSAAVDAKNWGEAHGYETLARSATSVFIFLKDHAPTWAQEICIYMFVWMAKFGAAYGVRTGIHVGVDVALNRLAPSSRKQVILFGLYCGALFTCIVGTLGARFVLNMAEGGQVSADLELPMWIVYLAVPLGSYLMCFRFLQVAWNFAHFGDLPHHDHGHVEGIDDETPLIPGVVGADTHATPGGTR